MAEKKMLCPLMQRPCIEDGDVVNGEHCGCKFWVKVQGKHPQTGVVMDHGDCAFAWTPVLMIENTKVNRETGAAVESFRNNTMDVNAQTQQMFMQAMMSLQSRSGIPSLPRTDTSITEVISNDETLLKKD